MRVGIPHGEHLGEGIRELRTRVKKVRLRMLYFFYERETAVVTHGFRKDTRKVPPIEIKRAKDRRLKYQTAPDLHTLHWERDNE
ncbi:type II toxin-antitoxin system RelE/ParE family toxin [Thermodesulfobacteriota bacterium]